MIFLVEYERKSGDLLKLMPFEANQREKAEDARIALEKDLLHKGISHEVVILEARDEQRLRVTHRRYFEQLSDFANPKSAAS